MYREFFKFKKDPFEIAPAPEFFFLSQSHKEALDSISYGIQSKNGFVVVTGELGAGKTAVLDSYVKGADPEKIRIVRIVNAAVSFRTLLKRICSELGVLAAGKSPVKLLDALFQYLLDQDGKGRSVVLIIDEAQNMPVRTFDLLRILSNLETSENKLIQIILVGQPELEARLNLPELRRLNQRIAIRSRIEGLTADQSIAYIHHRLMRASSSPDPVFTKGALKIIIKRAKGIPLRINILCGNALAVAFGYERKAVDEKTVKEAIRDFGRGQNGVFFSWKILWAPIAVACFAAAVFLSPSLLSRFQTPGMSKKSIGSKRGLTSPAVAKAAQSDGVPSFARLFWPKPARTSLGTKPAGHGESAEKKKEAVTAVRADAAIAVKPKSTPAVHGPKLVARSIAEGKTGSAVVGVKPPVFVSSQNQPSPAALTTPAASGFSAQATASFAPGTRPGGKPLLSVAARKGDCVSKILFRVYGGVSEDMLRTFKKLNPQVRDVDKILAGEKIFLPRPGP